MTTTTLIASEVQPTDCERFVRCFRVSGCAPRTPFHEVVNVDGIPKMREPLKPGSNWIVFFKRVTVTADPLCFDVFVHYVEKFRMVGVLMGTVAMPDGVADD